MLPTKNRFIWSNGLREEFNKSTFRKKNRLWQLFVNGSGRNEQSSERTFHRCFQPSFGSFGQSVSEEKNLKKSANQKQELPVVCMFVNGSGRNEQSLQGAGSSIDASYKVSVHLANRFQKRRF
jgi:hypothetical protein